MIVQVRDSSCSSRGYLEKIPVSKWQIRISRNTNGIVASFCLPYLTIYTAAVYQYLFLPSFQVKS